MKNRIAFILLIVLIAGIAIYQPIVSAEILYDSYKGPLGIEIKSYTSNWRGDKLKDIYTELLNNTYGEEIDYLSTINLYPNNPFGGEEEGLYHGAFISKSFLNKTNYKMKNNRVIDLFNMDKKNNIDEIAKTLSHEYGHHFTLYYLLKGEKKTFDQWQETKYAKIRGLAGDARVRHDYSNGHQWNITEIAAEDYVQLFGSPNAKRPYFYDDIITRAKKQESEGIIKWSNHIYNVYPQENFYIPLANDILGLGDYWASLSGIDIKDTVPLKGSRVSLTEVKDLGHNKKQFIIRWTENNENTGLLYTLVAYDEGQQQVIPIKTVKQGEELMAVIGSTKITNKNEIIYYSDTFTDQSKSIRVYTMNNNGKVVSSNTINLDFNNPQITELHLAANEKGFEDDEDRIDGELPTTNSQEKSFKKGWLDNFFDFIINLIGKFF
ncbi:MAG TPA: hypothetical protein GXZ78_07295 [Eubacteriaceae bacterium]|nr:hypothetical protein [Eubacteriaceae bacterium]